MDLTNGFYRTNGFLRDGHLDAILDFLEAPGDSPTPLVCYCVHISGATMKMPACLVLFQAYSQCFCLNNGHFGRHLGFLGQLQGGSPGLLVCCSTNFSEPILKMSACYEKCPGFI